MLPTTAASSPNSNEPPPPNPLLTAYEGWVQRTPLVTRYILSLQAFSYLTSWFLNFDFALATTPYYVVFRFEFYRLILSPLINTSIVSCILGFLSFSDNGRRLEQSMGSTAFGWLCCTIGLTTNLGFVLVSFLLAFVRGYDESFLFVSSTGLGNIIFGIIAMECVQAPRHTQRAFLLFVVPAVYFPLVLYFFFSLLNGSFSLDYLISMGVGYASGFGSLDKLIKLSPAKAKQWEDTVLSNYARREGWIAGHAAVGSGAWHDDAPSAGFAMSMFGGRGGSGGSTPGSGNNGDDTIRAGSVFRPGPSKASAGPTGTASEPTFPSSSGRTLGGGGGGGAVSTSRRTGGSTTSGGNTAAETRAARLQALEQRQAQQAQSNNNPE
ncbi:hypothetical protein ACA910_016509 [Epithemia clementina (nom. ined.)]